MVKQNIGFFGGNLSSEGVEIGDRIWQTMCNFIFLAVYIFIFQAYVENHGSLLINNSLFLDGLAGAI